MGAVAGMFNVFLNHRGPDVKKDFVAHLYEALLDAGLHPFMDMESLVKGQHGLTSIDEALRGASVHVAVFSKGYADSTYCLQELCAMLESKKLVIPVFYNVSPDDLLCTNKLQKGPYADAFRQTHKKQPQAQVEKWKKALHDAAGLFGFKLADYNENAARLKKDVVIAVQKALHPSAHLQPVAKYAVGLDQSSRSVIETLNQMGDNVGVLSVVGMGGIGKTTLATEVFNHFAKNDTSKFEKQSFLKNVRESPVLDLQKQLVRDLLDEDVKTREDFNHWFDLFMGRKVLIVIDDIDKKPQFEQLIPEINKLARGSRVLITSRDRNLVANIMEKAECKHASHEVAALNNPDARQLFNSHAFDSSNVTDGFHDVAQRVADACAGLPLALEVIGSFLFDKRNEHDLDCWEQTIKTLHEEKDILDKLKISYDGLSTGASQLMFLDIACFFIGKHETMAMQIFESCSYDYKGPAASFRSLMDKSLVKLDGDGRIVMHDLLRDMGREVVKNQSLTDKAPPSHLWDPEMAERVLANREGTNRVRGLSVAGKGNGAACVAENYTSMNALHFLLLDGCDVKGDFSTWSLELSWLQWRSSPLSALPLKLDLLKLAVLDLTDSKSLTRIWPSGSELEFPCKELQTLILENCSALEELPQNFGKLSILKDLNMRGCSTIEALPDSMCQLRELEHLNLSSCGKLGSLPDSIVHLSKLKTIQLNQCTQLNSLPMAFGELQSLVEFWAEGSSLSHLPDTFSLLSNLEHLHLYKCSHIQDLPPSMSGLGKLKVLHMGQTRVQTLPEDFGKLGSLIELNLQECDSFTSLPDNFGLLSELQKLVMHHNKNFVKLPEGFGRLQALAELDLGACSIEEKGLSSDFGNLSALRRLLLQDNKLAILPESFRDLGPLVFLEMHHCPNLIDVQALPWNLEYMDIGDCPNLTDIPFLGKMSLLKCLILCNCTRLTQLQGLESLPSLVEINVAGCTMLESVSGLNHNRALEQCYLSGSKISMKYDNDWLKKEPAAQVVSYYEDTLGFARNGMAQEVTSKEWANELCMETILTNLEECIAVIFSFVAHDQGWSDYPHDDGRYAGWCCSMEARIVRNNEDVYISSLFRLRHADMRDQMYLCTLRRLHPFVHALQHGDKIRVYARSSYKGWAITVEQGAVCAVHATKGELDHEKVHVVMNGGSETHPSDKSVNESFDDEVKVKLATLQLADNPKFRQHALQVAPTFTVVVPAAETRIHFHDTLMVYTMPRSLRDLHNLVTLGIYHCLNLRDVQALPQSLQYLDICDCPKLKSIPSLDNLSLLRSLTLCKCTKLTQIQGLDSLISLVEVNLTGCTMLQNAPGLNHNNTLEKCYLSGSKVCMPYDSNWLKKQPAEQVVSYYDNTLGFANNGMAIKVKSQNGHELCMETIVTEHEECSAVIFSFVAHDQGWSHYAHEHGHYNSQCSMEARIIRNNEEIQTCELFRLRHADKKDQVYLCTLRKLHPFVNALQHGDKIRVYAQSSYQGWTITVKEGVVCVLHDAPRELDHDEICVVVNGGIEASSSVGANLSSKEVKAKLTTLQLVDNASHQMNTIQQRILSVDWVPVMNPRTGQPMIFQCKGCSCRPIITLRWHCDICPDFNLCSNCHKGTSLQQLHNHEHPMSVVSEPDGSFIFSGANANVGRTLTSDPQFNSWYSEQQSVPQIADGQILPP